MDVCMTHSRRIDSAGAHPAGWKADLARDDALDEDRQRLLQGMAWGSAISTPFWLAVLAALIWL